jgi:hypothetical protein
MKARAEIVPTVWEFVRGDMRVQDFEQWLYTSPRLEAVLGAGLYVVAVETDFRDRDAVWRLKNELRAFAVEQDQGCCHCVRYSNLAVVDMGEHDDLFSSLSTRYKRGEPFWWLYVSCCSLCGQYWLVAQEERHNDVFIMRRLETDEVERIDNSDQWPDDFDQYETLLKIGRDAGRSVIYADPLNSSLVWTVGDLAKARPGIKLSELASLLNVSTDLAADLAREASKDEPLDIVYDSAG